jgi:hypothetical protein
LMVMKSRSTNQTTKRRRWDSVRKIQKKVKVSP